MIAKTDGQRLERVRSVVEVGRKIADPEDPIGREARRDLHQSIALSPEGVELALRELLETNPTEGELAALVEGTEPAERCQVVLSANVCIGALRAIALGVASAPVVHVKASRRDPTLARMFVRELATQERFCSADGQIYATDPLRAQPGDLVYAYGSDETLASIAGALPVGATLIGHGSGFGIAVVGERSDLESTASLLAEDVAPFDQRGCLSPRLVLVEGGVERARLFASALDVSLGEIAQRIPRGRLDESEVREIARYVELMRAAGEVLVGASHVVGFDPDPEGVWLGPACRVVHVLPMEAIRVSNLLAPVARHVANLGVTPEADEPGHLLAALRLICPGARTSRLGRMQRPALDGPVDLRALARFSR